MVLLVPPLPGKGGGSWERGGGEGLLDGASGFTAAERCYAIPVMPQPIRILAPAKEKGDLFTRLVSDLFLALGYDHPRLNIHKTGREIDVDARHRLLPRRALAECKATARPIGGDDVNKFAGVLDAERRRTEKEELDGYFISLAGFTEAAREQEKELERLVLVDGKRVVEELVQGRIVVSPVRAVEQAGRCASGAGKALIAEERPELLAHALGWVWAVQYRRDTEVTHVALVHADGFPLSPKLAKEILDADRQARGDLHPLTYLAPSGPAPAAQERLLQAREVYLRYLAAECGEIELEGLPADHDIGIRRLRLESLFIPLHLEPAPPGPAEETAEPGARTSATQKPEERVPVGKVLADRAHLAILALPGGGKTTLLKRLAVAYAFPDRRSEIGDLLPQRHWFPLFIRCRQIEDRATEPIIHLLGKMGERAELGDLAEDFRALVLVQIREGKALLLIDGLDEIADPGQRMAFVHQLRTFLSTYPGVSLVVTSREAGFRLVAGSLSAHCDHFRIAGFDRSDIEHLTVAWHREVVGKKPDVEAQARALADSIWETDRVRRLAVNPLLLTTLLLVRRWVGQLPSRRSVLYEKAIEVLLWTWNVEGFAPLDVEEVTPQLAFLAWQMMEDGVQQVSQPRLRQILQKARQQMPEVLEYAKLGVSDFVDRVEGRSGLLVLSGQRLEDGRLVPVYDFRHLTFQEYLAAKALVEGYYPDRAEADTLVSKLAPQFQEESWKEVVPLVAVLAGRKAAPLVEALVDWLQREGGGTLLKVSGSAALLVRCFLDEVQLPPDLVDRALDALARNSQSWDDPWALATFRLAGGRYGPRLREVVWRSLSTSDRDLLSLGHVWLSIGFAHKNWVHQLGEHLLAEADSLCRSEEPRDRALGLLLGMRLAQKGVASGYLTASAKAAVFSSALWEQFAGCWALGALYEAGALPDEGDIGLTHKILELCLEAKSQDLMDVTAWALSQVPLPKREAKPPSTLRAERVRKVIALYENPPRESVNPAVLRIAALLAAFYWQRPWSDEELVARLLNEAKETVHNSVNLDRLVPATLSQLGEAGRAALRELEAGAPPKALTPVPLSAPPSRHRERGDQQKEPRRHSPRRYD